MVVVGNLFLSVMLGLFLLCLQLNQALATLTKRATTMGRSCEGYAGMINDALLDVIWMGIMAPDAISRWYRIDRSIYEDEGELRRIGQVLEALFGRNTGGYDIDERSQQGEEQRQLLEGLRGMRAERRPTSCP